MIDVQKQNDTREIDIQKVGVKDVETPLIIQRKHESNQVVYAKAKMSVSLPRHYKGTHMSRFIEILNDFKQKNILGVDIRKMLEVMQKKLEAKSSYLKFDFKYFIEKIAPVSKMKSLMSYDCFFEGTLDENDYKFFLGVKVPVTTLCPCSKEISKAGAHNQRAIVKAKISYNEDEHIWLEDLIDDIETCASSPLYSLLKREDEKFVTESAYDNPKFVEDIIRDVVLKFEENKIIKFYEVEIEAQESIHNHNAWAYQKSK
ncbi:MAG: GTP cyclohydrolase I FolE2 [Cyanobacteria bacterium SIG30]|nr:GTP cyclohydrolase I FolE2 [Cyanobacteria bacterium SIG30]